MERKKLIKNAIAVYDPSDGWEQAIQSASKNITGHWLSAYPCRLLARAVASLKCNDEWINNEELMGVRAFYLFAPEMVSDKNEMVFPTHLLYLRDILENQEINASLHAPITFVTKPLAHFLFRDCPVHIRINNDLLRAQNKKADILDVGGCTISEKDSLNLDGVISGITHTGNNNDIQRMQAVVRDIQNRSGISFTKAASQEVEEDVFSIEEHYQAMTPESTVYDKINRSRAEVTEMEPSENGMVRLRYEDGNETVVPKEEFDQQFTVIEHV